MENIGVLLVVIFGIVLRLAIPIAITILCAVVLRRLDEHWQAEANSQPVTLIESTARNPGCWNLKGCSEEMKRNCQAFAHPDTPCWQVFRDSDGRMQEKCLGCEVLVQAPVPVQAHVYRSQI